MDTILSVDDDSFVRAPAARCYRVLADVAGWPSFWPATSVDHLGGHRFTIVGGRRPRRLRLRATAGAWRDGIGFTFDLDGDLRGRWEIWLEPGWGGTVVHHIVDATGTARWQRRAVRPWIRHGAWGLKDLLEHEAPATAPPAADAAVDGGGS